ncbi:hypothetical protein PgNI_10111 [Pyricularia grisea]|uniref:Uncharacterized protein n=1 Tax=Pyricularia grisea TaxID=148305 RepID=A0A6P8AX67_PYRGI|nr:hypothetical protein PgNI_10111 [Pyricularia grisea]TLD06876.1 hypothetical protein PgNI_10111 [Pyricularia grisea]
MQLQGILFVTLASVRVAEGRTKGLDCNAESQTDSSADSFAPIVLTSTEWDCVLGVAAEL